MVKIQYGERLAITPEQTFTPDKVTYLREAKREGYRAATQVKGWSPEIDVVSVADTVQGGAGRILTIETGKNVRTRRGRRPQQDIKRILQELGRTNVSQRRYVKTNL